MQHYLMGSEVLARQVLARPTYWPSKVNATRETSRVRNRLLCLEAHLYPLVGFYILLISSHSSISISAIMAEFISRFRFVFAFRGHSATIE